MRKIRCRLPLFGKNRFVSDARIMGLLYWSAEADGVKTGILHQLSEI
jgi:hypothetical protein